MIATSTSDDLLILFEPEAAAIALTHDITDEFFAIGKRFVVVDCGGGTLDVTSHEVLASNPISLRSLAIAAGVTNGSELITERFVVFLKGLLSEMGPAFMADLRKNSQCMLEIERDFDAIKVAFRLDGHATNTLSLKNLLGYENFSAFEPIVQRYNDANPTRRISRFAKKSGSLTLSNELLLSFFEASLEAVVNATQRVLDDAGRRGSEINSIVVVGGFASSEVLQNHINRAFPVDRYKVLFPTIRLHPQAAVVVGAARGGCLAHLPNTAGVGQILPIAPRPGIANRIAQYSYGVFFEPDQFRPLVLKGEDVPVDFMREFVGYPLNDDQEKCLWILYRSEEDNPQTITGETTKRLGCLPVDIVRVGTLLEREMRAKFTFGQAEVRIKVTFPRQNNPRLLEANENIRFTHF